MLNKLYAKLLGKFCNFSRVIPKMYSSCAPGALADSLIRLRASSISLFLQSIPGTSLPSDNAAAAPKKAVGAFLPAVYISSAILGNSLATLVPACWRPVASSVMKSYQCFSSSFFFASICSGVTGGTTVAGFSTTCVSNVVGPLVFK